MTIEQLKNILDMIEVPEDTPTNVCDVEVTTIKTIDYLQNAEQTKYSIKLKN